MERDAAILTARGKASGDWLSLVFLTPSSGKVRVAARRPSRWPRVVFYDALQSGELLFTPPDERRPGRLHAFDCDEVWPAIRSDFNRLVTALHVGALATAMAGEGEASPELFELAYALLRHLDKGGDPASLRIVFEMRLLSLAGYGSSVNRCYGCQGDAEKGEIFFSAREGGIVCDACRKGRGGPVKKLSRGALSVMKSSLALPVDRADRLRISTPLQEEILPLLREMIEGVVERNIPSAEFLMSLKGP